MNNTESTDDNNRDENDDNDSSNQSPKIYGSGATTLYNLLDL